MTANDPAFPVSGWDNVNPGNFVDAHGLTKREWFAGMALQGLYANSGVALSPEEYAAEAFAAADAMIAGRET